MGLGWQAGAEALLMAAEGRGPLMHARIGMLRALNHGQPEARPSRLPIRFRMLPYFGNLVHQALKLLA